jgi:methyl-accepting chemotaxis protein
MNLTIAKRLWVMIGVATAALVVVGATGLFASSRIEAALDVTNTDTLPSIAAIDSIRTDVLQIKAGVVTHILSTSVGRRAIIEKSIDSAREHLDASLKQYQENLVSDEDDKRLIEADAKAIAAFEECIGRVLEPSRAGDGDQARLIAERLLFPAADVVTKALDEQTTYNAEHAQQAADEGKMVSRNGRFASWGVIALGIALVGGFGLLLIRSIGGALNEVQSTVSSIQSNLDFTRRISVKGRDELGVTASALNRLLDTVQDNLKSIAYSAEAVAGSSRRMASVSDQVAHAANSQSEAASSMAASVEEMTVSISHVGDRAGEANTLSVESGHLAKDGERVIAKTVDDINQIALSVGSASAKISELGAQTERISAVVGVIRDVADQTNLLALNAAIEAARAGEQGRGFAVVADEVRKLAERTAQSTREISAIVDAVRNGAQAAIEGMRQAVDQVGAGVERAQDASSAIRKIGEANSEAVGMVGEITDAIREQSTTSTSIAQQIERIAQMAEESSVSASESAATARELDAQAESMQRIVTAYRL